MSVSTRQILPVAFTTEAPDFLPACSATPVNQMAILDASSSAARLARTNSRFCRQRSSANAQAGSNHSDRPWLSAKTDREPGLGLFAPYVPIAAKSSCSYRPLSPPAYRCWWPSPSMAIPLAGRSLVIAKRTPFVMKPVQPRARGLSVPCHP